MYRLLALAGTTALAAALLLLVLRARAAEPAPAQAAATPISVTSVLPAWRAPGVAVPISGFAGANERVVLRANGRIVGTTTSGRLGAFHLRFVSHVAGTFRLEVSDGLHSLRIGAVVVRPVTLEAVGDITFGEQVGPAIAASGAAYPWTFVASTLRAADITTGNLETSVSTRGTPAAKEYTFRGAPQDLPALHTVAGFDVLTLANNHAVDYGRDALLDTLRYVHADGMESIGAGANGFQAHRPAIVERGGLKVAFLGYSDVNPAGFVATADAPGTAAADVDAIGADVHAALRRADVAVCFFHWGVELHPDPDSRQQLFAQACLRAGAKLVVGAHPHVLGPVTRPSSTSLIAWSLGNFVFPSSGTAARTAILEVSLDTTGVRGYQLLPVRIDGFRPRPAG